MKVYRVTHGKYANDISGIGASLFPGRWNPKGVPLLYTGTSASIAMLEFLVNAELALLNNIKLLTIEIPDDSISTIHLNALPEYWNVFPFPNELQQVTSAWLQNKTNLATSIPSALLSMEKNMLINPQHPRFKEVKIVAVDNLDSINRFRTTKEKLTGLGNY